MPVTISLVRKRVGFAFGRWSVDNRHLRPYRPRFFDLAEERYVTERRGLVYRDEESETAQVENVEFLKFTLKIIVMNVR